MRPDCHATQIDRILCMVVSVLSLTAQKQRAIMYLLNNYTIARLEDTVEIIISSNTSKPIYEQITSQIKAMIMSGELQTGDPIPSMRALAKSIHVSVITVQRAYEDLQRDGFIETTVGRGSFVSAQNKDFFKEEQQRKAEEHLQEAAEIGRASGIPLEKLAQLLERFYQEGE
jgi:GntR family transcriptional regulator